MSTVKIYSTPTCIYCNLAKEFFDAHKIKYENFDVSEDLKKRKEMVDKSGQMGVPVIIIVTDSGEEVIVGFQEERISKLLGL
ncbi:MAG TPA: glutaredoxin domain-containing protein [Candidatus Paceibacterota bacterium]|nr:glutaredoxin domain-containing protein [Candidatus Paceibacterota bacterium]HRZ34621.1 glutaredoxin domain-containing protein [Candidatus Paceibacterota bacterium]